MKFTISRTSSWDRKPCKEAVKESHRRVDSRTCPEEEFNARNLGNGKTWRDEGTNHRTVKRKGSDAKIARDFPSKRWVIEIADLDALIAFSNKYGPLVFKTSYEDPDEMEIEIYDDYRE